MKISVKQVKKSSSALNRTGSRNSIKKNLFIFLLGEFGMKPKDFAMKMNEFGFNWKVETVYALMNQAKAVHLDEARAICSILGCELTEIFPVFADIQPQKKGVTV